jgi:hypothetical protein
MRATAWDPATSVARCAGSQFLIRLVLGFREQARSTQGYMLTRASRVGLSQAALTHSARVPEAHGAVVAASDDARAAG